MIGKNEVDRPANTAVIPPSIRWGGRGDGDGDCDDEGGKWAVTSLD